MQSLGLLYKGPLQRLPCSRPTTALSLVLSSSEHLQTFNSLWLGGVRFRHSKRINAKAQSRQSAEGIQYHGFKYFPRFPDHKDPPYEATKLFMVKRIRTLWGIPYWEKDLITKFGLSAKGAVGIVKNTPVNNANLYKIKHLIEITPITTPFGMPDNPAHAVLKENGQLIACNSLPGPQLQLEEAKIANESLMKKSVDGNTLKTRLHLKWYSRW